MGCWLRAACCCRDATLAVFSIPPVTSHHQQVTHADSSDLPFLAHCPHAGNAGKSWISTCTVRCCVAPRGQGEEVTPELHMDVLVALMDKLQLQGVTLGLQGCLGAACVRALHRMPQVSGQPLLSANLFSCPRSCL
jgi:hypothetical protein